MKDFEAGRAMAKGDLLMIQRPSSNSRFWMGSSQMSSKLCIHEPMAAIMKMFPGFEAMAVLNEDENTGNESKS